MRFTRPKSSYSNISTHSKMQGLTDSEFNALIAQKNFQKFLREEEEQNAYERATRAWEIQEVMDEMWGG